MTTCVIAGGGVVGMLCALLASDRYEEVVLVEKSESFGGLLGSFERHGALFDYGTHVPARAGIADLDRLLYGPPDSIAEHFHLLPYLRSENYFGGRWNETSPLIDVRTLAPAAYAKGVVELLQAPGAVEGESNLLRYLLATFGDTITHSVYGPVFEKLLGAELGTLHREVLRIFGLQRVVALTAAASRELKSVPRLDNSLAFHSYAEGSPPLPYLYPRGNNGIGRWTEDLLGRLRSRGVKLVAGDEVRRIEGEDAVRSVHLASGGTLGCTRLVWTIPPALAMRAAGMTPGGPAPAFRTHTLCHFRFRDPLLKTVPQYLLCWAPEMLSYRITLYPNISPDRAATGVVNLTVEVLGNAGAGARTAEIERRVESELVEMGVVAAGNPVLDRHSQFLGNSFPVYTEALPGAARGQAQQLLDRFANLSLFGRSAGPAFFINDLLVQAYHGMLALHD